MNGHTGKLELISCSQHSEKRVMDLLCVWTLNHPLLLKPNPLHQKFRSQNISTVTKNFDGVLQLSHSESSTTLELDLSEKHGKYGKYFVNGEFCVDVMNSSGIPIPVPPDGGENLPYLVCKTRSLNRVYSLGKLPASSLVEGSLVLRVSILTFERQRSAEFRSHMKSLLDDPTFSDVTIRVEDAENGVTEFTAHKALLGIQSDVFRNMLLTPMAESTNSIIKINGFPADVVKGMLEFIYTGKTYINFMPRSAESFIGIAHLYNLEGLKYEAEREMGLRLYAGNVINAFKCTLLYRLPVLKVMVVAFIKRNKMSLATNPEIKELAATNLEAVLELFEATSKP